MLKRLLSEPLFHFALLALLIFAGYAAFAPKSGDQRPDTITVTGAKIEQMAAIFAKTWQRPPSAEEMKGLVDDYVKEEIYVREAIALGLDKDDTVIRRRLRQKMEFLADAGVEALSPDDAELEAFLKANPKRFERDPQVAFQQVFLNPDRHGEGIEADARTLLETLRATPEADRSTLGDASMLPPDVALSSLAEIGQQFGPDFATAVRKLGTGSWAGPIASPFGLHIVRVVEQRAGRLPPLAEIRDAVLREWTNDKRQAFETDRMNELLKRYRVSVDATSSAAAKP